MSAQAEGGLHADTLVRKAPRCTTVQVTLYHLSYCFQNTCQGFTLSACLGVVPGGCGSFASPTLMLTKDLPHKEKQLTAHPFPPSTHSRFQLLGDAT